MRAFALLALTFVGATPSVAQTRTIVDPDSVVSIVLPEAWKEYDLEVPDASIQMSSPLEDAFFMAIIEDKGDLFGWNLTRYSYLTVGQMMAMLDFPDIPEAAPVEVDGSQAMRYVVSGASSGVQVTYLRLTIDAPTAFIQLLAWTSRSKWEEQKPLVEEIMASVDLLR